LRYSCAFLLNFTEVLHLLGSGPLASSRSRRDRQPRPSADRRDESGGPFPEHSSHCPGGPPKHSPARARAIMKTRPSRSERPPSRSASGPRRRARTRGARRCASRSKRAPPPSASPWPPPAPRPAWLPPFSRAGAARRGGLRGQEGAGAEAKWAVAAGGGERGRVGASGGGRERARDCQERTLGGLVEGEGG